MCSGVRFGSGLGSKDDLDDAGLGPKAARRVRQLAAKAVRLGVPRITVFGHADSSGGGRHNLSLSLRRAARVEQALIESGVARSRVGIAAAGETRPRIATANGVPERRNRRVEVLFQPAVGW